MKRLVCLSLLLATSTEAAERRIGIEDFDQIRVEGPFEVHVTTRGIPGARITGPGNPADAVEVRVEARTLIVRAAASGGGGAGNSAPVLYLRTTDLRSASVVAGGKLDITGPMRGPRITLEVSGSGSITASGVDTEQLFAALIGTGTMAIGGHALRARLLTSGAGSIEAVPLRVDDLVLRLDGTGTVRASARYSANVVTSGLGPVTVYGKPKCSVKAPGGGSVNCGVSPPAAN